MSRAKKAKGTPAAAWFYGPQGFGSSSVNPSVVKCGCLECWAKVDPRAGLCEPCANGDHEEHAGLVPCVVNGVHTGICAVCAGARDIR